MKKTLIALMMFGTLLLCGCARDLPLESIISLETDFPTEPLKEIVFSECNISDYAFTTACNLLEDGVYKRYSGEIVDEEIKKRLWEILCEQEQMDTYQGGSWGGGTLLTLTDKRTGETFTAGYTMWYATPEVEGGPICFVISGASCGSACYYPIDYGEDWEFCASERFETLLSEGVKCAENIVSEEKPADNPFSASTIVLAEVRSNWADGFAYYGTVIDLDGNMYQFDFSDDPDQAISWEEAGQRLYEMYGDGKLEHASRMNADVIEECWMQGMHVDPHAVMKEEHNAYDMGQNTLCLFDSETGALIPLRSTGDYHRELQDDAAKEIIRLFDSMKN